MAAAAQRRGARGARTRKNVHVFVNIRGATPDIRTCGEGSDPRVARKNTGWHGRDLWFIQQ